MAYRHARQKIAALVEATTPSRQVRGLAARFAHDESGEIERIAADSRRFFLRALSGEAHAPSTASFQRRTIQLAIVVDYADDVDVSLLDEVIVEDADAIIATLATGQYWATSTSTIVAISAPADSLLPYTIEDAGNGAARRLTLTAAVTYDTRTPT